MMSINKDVTLLHASYCTAMALDLPMNMVHERQWLLGHLAGLTPDDVRLVLLDRLKFNRSGPYKKGVLIHHLVGDEERIAVTLNEAAVLKASMRIKLMEPAKAQVLRQSGRSDAAATPDAVKVDAIPLLDALRRAAQ